MRARSLSQRTLKRTAWFMTFAKFIFHKMPDGGRFSVGTRTGHRSLKANCIHETASVPRFRAVALVSVGVDELAQEKLTPLLRLKYHDFLADAVADLGKPEEIGRVFAPATSPIEPNELRCPRKIPRRIGAPGARGITAIRGGSLSRATKARPTVDAGANSQSYPQRLVQIVRQAPSHLI